MFAKFFRPKWQSDKADVRIRAISRMLADDPEQQEILSRLAQTDQDLEVRKAALARITTPEALLRILENDPAAVIRQAATEQLCRMISSETDELPLDQRLHCVENVLDQDLLTHIALNSPLPQLQQAAVERIRDDSNLEVLILNAQGASTRRLAAQRLDSEDTLERVSRLIRQRDKAVYRILRDKLQQRREAARAEEELHSRRLELVERFEQLARGELLPQYGARVDALGLEWQKLPSAGDALERRYAEAFETCRRRAADAQAEAEARERAARQQAEARRARDELLAQLAGLERHGRQSAADGSLDPAALRNQLTQWQSEWRALPPEAGATDSPDDRLAQLGRLADCVEAAALHAEALDELLQQPADTLAPGKLRRQQQRIEALLHKIGWPEGLHHPERLQRAAKALRLIRERRDALQQRSDDIRQSLQAQLDELEAAIVEGHVKQAGKLHQRAADALELLNGKAPAALDQRFKQLHARLQELRDWQGFAVTPKKEQLCTEMESLVDSDLPVEERADGIRRLQQQWKTLDSTDAYHSQSLWRRFKEASDRAYAPCEDHFAQLGERRRENLEQRITICDQLDTYVASIDWDAPDWKGIETVSRAAKQEWKQYSPVDRGPGKAVQQRFNALLQQLDGRLQNHFQHCLEAKRGLVAAAAGLCDAEDPHQAARDAKELQRQWKEAGKTFRNQEQRLWKQFRGHCDQIFARLSDSQQQYRQQQNEQRHGAERLCRQLEQLLQGPSAYRSIRQGLEQARSAFDALDDEFSAAFAKRFEETAQALEQQCRELEQLRKGADVASLEARFRLCDELEGLLESADTDAWQTLQTEWDEQPPCSAEFAELIDQRYQLLCQVLQEPELLPELTAAAGEHLRQLCIQLEIDLGLPSPDEDQALRLEYQMQRLQQALEQHSQQASLADLQRLEYEWRCVPLARRHPELSARFYGHLDGLL